MSEELSDSPTISLARALIRRPSVTPEDAGCQHLIAGRLAPLGFVIEDMPFGQVKNLWARRGQGGRLFAFAGHTDVVPTGPLSNWTHPPFDAVLEGDILHGRGAADMKGSLAAMVTATERFLAAHPKTAGSIAFLLTSDEEGPSVDGTRRVIEALRARGEAIDACIVGEPSSAERLADTIKNGRRGSFHGVLTVHGIQGHVAYPEKAENPIHRAAPAIAELAAEVWDEGNDFFPPTTFQISNIHAGTGVTNVIPGACEVVFNLRFSTELDTEAIKQRVRAILDRHKLRYEVAWRLTGEPFLTTPGRFVEAVIAAAEAEAGITPRLSTSGGTSDGRFIAPTGTLVVELGPINATIHKVDEQVSASDLETLSRVYEGVLARYFATE